MKKLLGIFGTARKDGSEESRDFTDEMRDDGAQDHGVSASDHDQDGQDQDMHHDDGQGDGLHDDNQRHKLAPDTLDALPDDVELALSVNPEQAVEVLDRSTAEFDGQARAVADLGERHELIVARLGQIDEILQQLDDAHTLVGRLVKPLSATFRHHQAMTGQNIALQNALDHVNLDITALREREASASERAGSLDLKLHHLYDSYTEVQDLHVAAEAELRTVSSDLRSRETHILELERRLQELTVQIDELRDDLIEANLHRKEAMAAQSDMAQQLRQEQENYQALEQEHESLHTSVHHTVSEVAQLSRRLTDSEDVAMKSREQTLQLEAALADIQVEKVRLLEQVNELEQSIAEERRNLAVKAEGMRGRSVTLEKLLTQARDELRIQSDELRTSVQKNAELSISVERFETRCEKLLGDLHKAEEDQRHTEEARTTLAEQVETMAKAIQAKDISLHRAKDVLEAQARRLSEVEGKSSAQLDAHERRIASLAAALEQERTERALLEGTLEAARQEKLRMQKDLSQYRASRMNETPVEAPSTARPLPLTAHIADMPLPQQRPEPIPVPEAEPILKVEPVLEPVPLPPAQPGDQTVSTPVIKTIPADMRDKQPLEA